MLTSKQRAYLRSLAAAQDTVHQLREAVDGKGAEHEIDEGIAPADLFRHVRLLHHAAAERNDHIPLFRLDGLERADVAVNPVLGVFAHRAGIEQNEIRILPRIGKIIAHVGKHAFDTLRIGNVSLTTVGMYESLRQRFGKTRRKDLADPACILRLWNGVFVCHLLPPSAADLGVPHFHTVQYIINKNKRQAFFKIYFQNPAVLRKKPHG